MNRRRFLETCGVGSLAGVVLSSFPSLVNAQGNAPGGNAQGGISDTATVSFGAWKAGGTPPLDRFPNVSPGPANHLHVTPFQANIRQGGTVNFDISGLHQVIVYAPGKRPEDVLFNITTPTTGTPAGVPLIADSVDRVYRGLDPSLLPRDRVEVVQFDERGLHLVICGVQSHFLEGMYGFVRVV